MPLVPLVSSVLIAVSLPFIAVVEPAGVTVTSWPTVTSDLVFSGSCRVTTALPLPTMVIVPLLAESPLVSPTTPTVPAIGATRVAASRSSLADCRSCSAFSRSALADATARALDEVAVAPDEDEGFFTVVGIEGFGVVRSVTTACRLVFAASTSALAFAQSCSSALVGSLASRAFSCEADVVGTGTACVVALAAVVVSAAVGVAVGVAVADGDAVAVAAGLAPDDAVEVADAVGVAVGVGSGAGRIEPNTGSHFWASSSTARLIREAAARSTAGSMVTVFPVPEPEPEPLPEPLLEPDLLLVVVGFSAAYSEAFAWATEVSAFSTASFSGPVFSVASSSPASTVSPTETATALTVPSTVNAAATVLSREMVPVAV